MPSGSYHRLIPRARETKKSFTILLRHDWKSCPFAITAVAGKASRGPPVFTIKPVARRRRYKIRPGSGLAMVSMKREFPQHPVLCVGGVVIKRDSVLLIRRGSEPHKGEWSLPGGMVELGEKLEAAVRREIREETGLRVKPLELLMVFERIVRKDKKVRFHYTVLDFHCRPEGGKLQSASDAMDARWVRRADLKDYNLSPAAQRVIARAFDGPGRERRLS